MDGTAAYTQSYCSLYPDVLQLIPGGTAAYIVTCDFNENPKSDFDFDLGVVNFLLERVKGILIPVGTNMKQNMQFAMRNHCLGNRWSNRQLSC